MQKRTMIIGGVAALVLAGGAGTGIAFAVSDDDDDDKISFDAPALVDEDQARQLAQSESGSTTAKITKVEREKDDGVDKWEIELREGNTEWEYVIDAQSGDIVESDKDLNDD